MMETPRQAARRLAREEIRGDFKPEGLHEYQDADGVPLQWKIRVRLPDGSKWIRPMHVSGTVYRLGDAPRFKEGSRPLYRLPELAARPDEVVYFCEGEKCVDALMAIGLLATTSGSATSDERADLSPLAGRQVVAWPDNDAPGLQYIARVSDKLSILGTNVQTIDAAGLGLEQHGDAVDYLAAHPEADAAAIGGLPKLLKPEGAKRKPGDWPDIDPLPKPPTSLATPFPFDGLGGILGPAAKAIARDVQAPDAIAGASVLAAASLATQPLADVQLPHARLPLSLFILTAALSGDRKSATDTVACREVNELRTEQAREQSKLPQDENGKRPPVRSLIVSKATVEGVQQALRFQPHIGLFSTEGAELLGGHSMQQERRSAGIAFLCKSWDGGVLDTVTKGDGMIILLNRRVTISAMVQPIILERLLTDPLAQGQGLVARFLVAQPDSLAGTRLYRSVDPHADPAVQNYHRAMRKLLRVTTPAHADGDGLELNPRALRIDQQALSLWREFHDDVERLQAPGQELALCRPFASKAAEQAARVAGVLQVVSDPDAVTVTEQSMACGITIARFYLLEHLRLTGTSAANRRAQLLRELLAWMQSRAPFVSTADLLQTAPRGLRELKAEGLKPLLEELAGRHYIRPAHAGWEVRNAG